jgi:hypothetical protein
VLLFEFFPALVALVGAGVAVWLYARERRARREGVDDRTPVGSTPVVTPEQMAEKANQGRPSMRG